MKVYTGGTFDLFHTGHVNLLKWCKVLAGSGGRVIVGLNTDEFVERYKHIMPTVSYEDRKTVLLGCRYVDDVVKNEGDEDSKPAIIRVDPDMIVIGSDWHGRDYLAQMQFTWDWLREHHIVLTYVPNTPEISSTDIRGRLG